MKKHGVNKVSMESTSVYWLPIWRIFEYNKNATAETGTSKNAYPNLWSFV